MQDNLSMLVSLTQQIMEKGKEIVPVLKKEEKNIIDKINSKSEIPSNKEFEYLLRMYMALEFFGVSKNNFKDLLREYEKVDVSRANKFQDLYQSIV
jgi:cation transport regulator ChaC